MPSETIFDRTDGRIDVRVSWGNSGSGTVQVATLAAGIDPDPTERLINIVNEWLLAAGETPIDIAKLRATMADRKPAYRPEFDGWHATLDDWSGVNRLIKVLKRARDQAFGAPE